MSTLVGGDFVAAWDAARILDKTCIQENGFGKFESFSPRHIGKMFGGDGILKGEIISTREDTGSVT